MEKNINYKEMINDVDNLVDKFMYLECQNKYSKYQNTCFNAIIVDLNNIKSFLGSLDFLENENNQKTIDKKMIKEIKENTEIILKNKEKTDGS